MQRDDLADLTIFIAVAEEASFSGAARKLGMTQSGVSRTVGKLEARLGLRLLTRTTRSVAVTEAGERLLEVLQPALAGIDERLSLLTDFRERPAGTIRISTSEHAAETVVWPAVSRLVAEHPDINVELGVETGFVDIVSGKFDAGVRIGEQVEKDMIAVRIGPPLRMAAFASPAYLEKHGRPRTPRDLARHRCINTRFVSDGGVYAWEFEQDAKELRIKVEGQLTFNRSSLILAAAKAGHGIGFLIEDAVRPLIASGDLVEVLSDWCPPFDGYHLYYPTRRQSSLAFRLLVEALRYRG